MRKIQTELRDEMLREIAEKLHTGEYSAEQGSAALQSILGKTVGEKEKNEPPVQQAPTCLKCKHCEISSLSTNAHLFCEKSEKTYFSTTEANAAQCPSFNSWTIQYPIQVSSIESTSLDKFLRDEVQCVKVRPAKDKKTYLGFLLGDIAIATTARYQKTTQMLYVDAMVNPAIFVPELRKIVFGCESWWRRIRSLEDFSEITDEAIDSQWYVQLAKSMLNDTKK